jgi:hypothetical protein
MVKVEGAKKPSQAETVLIMQRNKTIGLSLYSHACNMAMSPQVLIPGRRYTRFPGGDVTIQPGDIGLVFTDKSDIINFPALLEVKCTPLSRPVTGDFKVTFSPPFPIAC